MKLILFFLVLVAPIFGTPAIQVFDSPDEEIIEGILAIQKTLVLPLDSEERPVNGFLMIQMTPDYLRQFKGKFLIAYCDGEMAGYLLLGEMEEFIDWAKGRRFDSAWNLEALRNIHYIDQIAVLTPFARQGVGKALVDAAKAISTDGLLTDILLEPITNQASIAFFTRQGFAPMGVMHIDPSARFAAHKIYLMLWQH